MDFKHSNPSNRSAIMNYGAEPISQTETRFCVWAPKHRDLAVEVVQRSGDRETVVTSQSLQREEQGNFSGVIEQCPVGSLYRYKFPRKLGRPDPYSRFQPFGVHGPSEVIDPRRYQWSDADWRGVKKRDLVIYELHVGSFTEQGTYGAATEKLGELKNLGITAVELLPVSQTPGRWNWGYDGVNFFAPRNTFGRPDELKAFVNACHEHEIAVILDVVYNHVGPEGNYLNEFGYYRSKRHRTPWGDALNFDGRGAGPVREFVISNVLYWLDEYHFDGVRLDAIHFMFDESEYSIVDEIRARVRHYAASVDREIHLIAESNIYDPQLVGDLAADGPYDAIWSDCLMHSIYSHGSPDVRLTNRQYVGTADLVLALEHAYVFSVPQAVRVTEADRQRNHQNGDREYVQSLIMALQTHDSVGNHPQGKRLHHLTCLEFQKAAVPLILLYPSIPMIFMGEEWASESPFPFFADFEDPQLRQTVDQGRKHEYPQHDWRDSPLPSDPRAFLSSKLNPETFNHQMQGWYRQLLAFRKQGTAEGWLDVKFKRTDHDLVQQIFRLVYETPDQRIVICSRLAEPEDGIATVETAQKVELLLDSNNPTPLPSEIQIDLQPRHCCIWVEPT